MVADFSAGTKAYYRPHKAYKLWAFLLCYVAVLFFLYGSESSLKSEYGSGFFFTLPEKSQLKYVLYILLLTKDLP